MNFSTKGVDTKSSQRVSPFMMYGIQNFRINSIKVNTAKTGSTQLLFNVETPTVKTPGFEPNESAKNGGQVARVFFPRYYMSGKTVKERVGKDTVEMTDYEACIKRIGIIADKMGVRAQVDAINASDFAEYIAQVTPLITGKFCWWKVVTEEYNKPGNDGKKGNRLYLAHFGFVASEAEGKDKLKFDASNTFDYQPATTPEGAATGSPTDDLPF